MVLEDAQGTISTRSGTWKWQVTERRGWPKSDVKGRRLGFEDPSNAVNRMSLELEIDVDLEELSEEAILRFSLVPLKRRFEDSAGAVWIARPVENEHKHRDESVGRVLLHSLVHGYRNVDLPPDRTLGDMKNDELLALV
jgi:hypothetical protein